MIEVHNSVTRSDKLNQWIDERLAEIESKPAAASELRFVVFTNKEVRKMPKSFRKDFQKQGATAHSRKAVDGDKITYEIIYSKKPFNVTPIKAAGATLQEAKAAFIAAVWECAEAGK